MKRFPIRPRSTLPALLTAMAGFLTTGCGSIPTGGTSGELPSQTMLALQPEGRQILVAWPGAGGAMQARLVDFPAGPGTKAPRPVLLPKNTFTMSWSRSANAAVVTTFSKSSSQLLKVDLATGAQSVLYESDRALRFPLETEDDTYVFLEGLQPGKRLSQWQRLASGHKTLLNPTLYGLASNLEKIGGSLHLLEPTKEFRLFAGPLPPGLRELVTPTTWSIDCADKEPLTCVRTHVFMPRDGGSFAMVDVVRDGRGCKVAGRWSDIRQVNMSRDGGTVVFHARPTHDGVRAVYAIDTTKGCEAELVFERGPD